MTSTYNKPLVAGHFGFVNRDDRFRTGELSLVVAKEVASRQLPITEFRGACYRREFCSLNLLHNNFKHSAVTASGFSQVFLRLGGEQDPPLSETLNIVETQGCLDRLDYGLVRPRHSLHVFKLAFEYIGYPRSPQNEQIVLSPCKHSSTSHRESDTLTRSAFCN